MQRESEARESNQERNRSRIHRLGPYLLVWPLQDVARFLFVLAFDAFSKGITLLQVLQSLSFAPVPLIFGILLFLGGRCWLPTPKTPSNQAPLLHWLLTQTCTLQIANTHRSSSSPLLFLSESSSSSSALCRLRCLFRFRCLPSGPRGGRWRLAAVASPATSSSLSSRRV